MGETEAQVAKEAGAAARRFLQSWQERDWYKMLENTQKSWASKHASRKLARNTLKNTFGARIVKGFTVTGGEHVGLCVADIEFTMDTTLGDKDGAKQRIHGAFRLVKEKGAYEPSEEGDWGVNPPSLKAWPEQPSISK
jgi:hypothetical protein